MSNSPVHPHLTGVPETALWTLYHRAAESTHPSPILYDPEAVRIVRSLDYPFRRRFGPPQRAFAVRVRTFDERVSSFLTRSPDGQIVALGEGLETQRFRIDNGRAAWLSVDLPQSIALRERFIQPDDRHRHLARSVLDFTWLDEIDPQRPAFISAQGLLMYLPADDVRRLLQAVARRLPGAWMMFDVIPDWVQRWTEFGLPAGPGFIAPPMSWALKESQQDILHTWLPSLESLSTVDYVYPDGFAKWMLSRVRRSSRMRSLLPTIFLLRFGLRP